MGVEKMTEEVTPVNKKCEAVEKTVLITEKEKAGFIICDVCGYANPENAGICKMCSNYLKGVQV